jgi:hypothetical protein
MAQGNSQCKGCKGNKNKLLAELKIMRLMQTRVNFDTRDADKSRAAVAELTPSLQGKILATRDSQKQVAEAMDKLHHATCPECLAEDGSPGGH